MLCLYMNGPRVTFKKREVRPNYMDTACTREEIQIILGGPRYDRWRNASVPSGFHPYAACVPANLNVTNATQVCPWCVHSVSVPSLNKTYVVNQQQQRSLLLYEYSVCTVVLTPHRIGRTCLQEYDSAYISCHPHGIPWFEFLPMVCPCPFPPRLNF